MYTAEDTAVLEEKFELENYSVRTEANRERLYEKYQDKLEINKFLTRSLISFQANKAEPLYRWFKYKEGFSSTFVLHMLKLFGQPHQGQVVLDPFAGIGTTITTSIQNGFDALGIELLSPGILAAEARIASSRINYMLLNETIEELKNLNFKTPEVPQNYFFQHVTITKGAFSDETELAIANARRYIAEKCANSEMRSLLKFTISSILEDVSFTRKDGQYLRWDFRSQRKLKSKFNKGKIHEFKPRLLEKLQMIQADLNPASRTEATNSFDIIPGSCLDKLHDINDESIDLVITSPPYCNRYDYTRTYALELAFDGVDNQKIKELRQTLLSATVENKSKYAQLSKLYQNLGKQDVFEQVVDSFRNQLALKEALASLYIHRDELNNKNIPDMVSNYFFEMNFVIRELARTLRPNGKIVMVNDNVRYNGDEIPVDLILSEFARQAGLQTDVIWVLERGKGNSSQQMGAHGRKEMRKCVYVWSK